MTLSALKSFCLFLDVQLQIPVQIERFLKIKNSDALASF